MANERKPSRRREPDDQPADEWDDLLDDGDLEGAFDDLDESPAPTPASEEPGAAEPETKEPETEGPVSQPMHRRRKEKEQPTEASVEAASIRRRRPVREETPAAPVETAAESPKRRKRSERRKKAGEESDFRPEDLQGAERTRDGLIRVKEGAAEKKKEELKQSWVKSLSGADYIGLAATIAILAGLAGMLLSWMHGEEWGSDLDRPLPVAELPAVGELFKITSIDSYWRRRTDTDRASASEIIIPEITIEVEPVGSQGHLSVFFRDPSGKMAADPGNLLLAGGQISVKANEGRQDAPNRFTFSSTKGFTFEPEFRSYISLEQMPHWSIEIVEMKEFGEEDKRLAYFEIAKDARTKEGAVAE